MTPTGWQPRLGTGLNIMTDSNTGQKYSFVSTPTEVTLPGTPFSPEIMNRLEQSIANSEIIYFDAAPTASTPGALGQFGAYDGMVYYCTGASISMSYGALQPGTYYFWAQNLPYSFTLASTETILTFDGATLSGDATIPTNCWPQGTEITLTDNSTYQWTALTPGASTIPISDSLAASIGLPNGSTIADALTKMESGVFLSDAYQLLSAIGQAGSANPIAGIAYGGGRYVAAIDGSTVMVSLDGTNWTTYTVSPAPITGQISAIAYGNGYFLAVGSGGVMYSVNGGTQWQTFTSGIPSGEWTGVAYINGTWAICGTTGIYSSTDLSGWTQRNTTAWDSMCNSGTALYVCNQDAVYSSADGVSWAQAYASGGTVVTSDGAGNVMLLSPNTDAGGVFYNGTSWDNLYTPGSASTITGGYVVDGTPYYCMTGESISYIALATTGESYASDQYGSTLLGGISANGTVLVYGGNSSIFTPIPTNTALTAMGNEFALNFQKFAIQREFVQDFIIAQGSVGIWTYRKYASGTMECWGVITCQWQGFTQAVYKDETFPTTVSFSSISAVTCGLADNDISDLSTMGWNARALSTNPSVVTAIVCNPNNNFTASTELNVSVHVLGAWK